MIQISTQFDTGQTTLQYWAEIAAGPATLPIKDASWTSGVAAYVARNKALAGALTEPENNAALPNDTTNFPMPSVGGNDGVTGGAENSPTTYLDNPERFVL